MENLEPPMTSGEAVTEPTSEMRHSGVGIASFVMGILATVALVAVIVYSGIKETTVRGGMSEGETIVVGLVAIVCCVMLLVGLILGIIGLFQSHARRLFAGIGVSISGIVGALVAALVWLGMSQA